jgi:hypothetical protein
LWIVIRGIGMFNITGAFEIDEPVTVNALDVKGIVDGLTVMRGNVIKYNVVYWYNGTRMEEWLYDYEIE